MANLKECKLVESNKQKYSKKIPNIINNVLKAFENDLSSDYMLEYAIPSKESIIEIIELIKDILFPGYFGNQEINRENILYHIGDEINSLYNKMSIQITKSIRHECLKNILPCTQCSERGYKETIKFLEKISDVKNKLSLDVQAALDGDPAAKSPDEVIFSYPGFFAILVYRAAHELYKQKIPLIPRIMSEYAHSLTGIDIHPGANISESFFIDHGTGVVIGETTKIGKNVRIYQGVTLGALSVSKDEKGVFNTNEQRHPTLEDNVIVYSNATILGGKTIIGKNSVVGGNVWITESVKPNTVVLKNNEKFLHREKKNDL